MFLQESFMKIVSLISLCAAFAAGPVFAQKAAAPAPTIAAPPSGVSPMRPGLWETTNVIATVGSDSKRTIVGRTCYAPADVADIARVLPRQREAGMKCENHDAKGAGANATWHVACASADGTLAGTADLSLTATTYSGHAELERKKRGAKPEKVTETLAGKWLEACK